MINSRTKGARGEREVLKLLGEELGIDLQRNLVQTREGGADCLCVRGFAIEIKRQERLSRPTWWRQACEQAARVGPSRCSCTARTRGAGTPSFTPGTAITVSGH